MAACEWCGRESERVLSLKATKSVNGVPVRMGEEAQDYRVCGLCWSRLAAAHTRVSMDVASGVRESRTQHRGRR